MVAILHLIGLKYNVLLINDVVSLNDQAQISVLIYLHCEHTSGKAPKISMYMYFCLEADGSVNQQTPKLGIVKIIKATLIILF